MSQDLVSALARARKAAAELREAMTEVRNLAPDGVRIHVTGTTIGGHIEAIFKAEVPIDRAIYDGCDIVCRAFPKGDIGDRIRYLKDHNGREVPDILPVAAP